MEPSFAMPLAKTEPLRREIERTLTDRPFTVRFWDGTEIPATSTLSDASSTANASANLLPTFTVRSPRALAYILRAPGQLGLGRAYVSGELDVDDLDALLLVLSNWKPPHLDAAAKRRLALAALRATGLTLPPPPPQAELRPQGRRHTAERDRRSVRHHYDLPPEFFALFLDKSMTYSCSILSRGAKTLEEAQETKLELVCTKLGLQAGERILDVGCGWGSFAVHAAKHHGVHVTGITLSPPQAERARQRAHEEGVADLVDIRVMDYRDIAGERYDAISSIGMVEHVGSAQIDAYTAKLASVLGPGGRLLNHGIARLRHGEPEAGPFSDRYVFPDAAPLHLSRVQLSLERAGFVTEHIEGFGADYADTLTHWIERLDANLERATELAGEERLRVWRVYLRAARNGFRTGFMGLYQVQCVRT